MPMEFKSDINFGDEFFSLDVTTKPPRIVTWRVRKIIFCDYNKDEYGNECPRIDSPDIEYGLRRYDPSISKSIEGVLNKDITVFPSKEKLMEFLCR